MSKWNCLYFCKKCGTLYVGHCKEEDATAEEIRALVKSKVKCQKCGRFAMLREIVKQEGQKC